MDPGLALRSRPGMTMLQFKPRHDRKPGALADNGPGGRVGAGFAPRIKSHRVRGLTAYGIAAGFVWRDDAIRSEPAHSARIEVPHDVGRYGDRDNRGAQRQDAAAA